MVVNILGIGLGPLSVARMSDAVFGDQARVGSLIPIVSGTCATIAGTLLWTASLRFTAGFLAEEAPHATAKSVEDKA